MRGYLLRRLLHAIFVVWAAYTVAFAVLFLLPGDPIETAANAGGETGQASQAQIADLRARYGLDQPLFVQYAGRLWSALHGDFGQSLISGDSVGHILTSAFPGTLALSAAALLLGVVAGSLTALVASYTQFPALRQFLLALPGLGISLPGFWIGLMLLELLSFQLRLFPAFGDSGFASLVLPAVTLALPVAAQIAQVLARSMQSTLEESYVDTARAKGAGKLRMHLKHAARNALIPALTLAGVVLGNTLANAVVVETVFARDGLGRIVQKAVTMKDFPVVLGVVITVAVLIVLINLTVDLLYPLLDPRITTRRAGEVPS